MVDTDIQQAQEQIAQQEMIASQLARQKVPVRRFGAPVTRQQQRTITEQRRLGRQSLQQLRQQKAEVQRIQKQRDEARASALAIRREAERQRRIAIVERKIGIRTLVGQRQRATVTRAPTVQAPLPSMVFVSPPTPERRPVTGAPGITTGLDIFRIPEVGVMDIPTMRVGTPMFERPAPPPPAIPRAISTGFISEPITTPPPPPVEIIPPPIIFPVITTPATVRRVSLTPTLEPFTEPLREVRRRNGKVKRAQSYNAFAKTQLGTEFKLNRVPLTKSKAKDMSAFFVDNSLSTKGRISKTRGAPQFPTIDIPRNFFRTNKRKFNDFKISKGKKIKTPNSFKEKNPFKFDTPNEINRVSLTSLISNKRRSKGGLR